MINALPSTGAGSGLDHRPRRGSRGFWGLQRRRWVMLGEPTRKSQKNWWDVWWDLHMMGLTYWGVHSDDSNNHHITNIGVSLSYLMGFDWFNHQNMGLFEYQPILYGAISNISNKKVLVWRSCAKKQMVESICLGDRRAVFLCSIPGIGWCNRIRLLLGCWLDKREAWAESLCVQLRRKIAGLYTSNRIKRQIIWKGIWYVCIHIYIYTHPPQCAIL